MKRNLTSNGIKELQIKTIIPIGILSLIIYSIKKQIKWKITLKIALFGIIGAIIGIFLADYIGGNITQKIFGGFLCIMGLTEIFKKQKP